MKLLNTRTYIAELAAAGRRHNALLTLFKGFIEHAKHLAAKEYPLKGIAIVPDGSTGFTARFLDVGAKFTFVDDSESGLVIHVSDISREILSRLRSGVFISMRPARSKTSNREMKAPITLVSTQTPQKLSSRHYISSYQSQAGPKH